MVKLRALLNDKYTDTLVLHLCYCEQGPHLWVEYTIQKVLYRFFHKVE